MDGPRDPQSTPRTIRTQQKPTRQPSTSQEFGKGRSGFAGWI